MDFKQIAVKALPYLGVALLSTGLGYRIRGWTDKPQVEIQEKEKIVEKQVTTESQKEILARLENLQVQINKAKDSQLQEKLHKEITESVAADGTKTKKTTVDKNIDSHVTETEVKTEVKVVTVDKIIEKERTVTVDKIVERQVTVKPVPAQWHIGVIAGVQPQLFPVPGINSYLIGAEAERRIIGPFFLGIWGAGTNNGQALAGLKLGLEF